jgi:hypothetical protein
MYITSKYIGPTNHRGSRYKATIDRGGDFKYQATVSYDYALDTEGNAVEAVKALIEKIDLNQYGVWDSFIVAYGPHGYTAVPSGRGVDHKTYSLRGETTLQSSSKGVA